MNKFRLNLIIALLLAMLPFGHIFAQDTETAYKAYVAAYQQYQTAINNRAAKAEIDQAISAYRSAKTAYENTLNIQQQPLELTADAIPSHTAGQPVGLAAAENTSSKTTSATTALMPRQLEALVDALKKAQSKASAKALIATLEKHTQLKSLTIEQKDAINYEIACAMDRLDIDRKKASAMLTELSNRASGSRIAQWAKARLNYIRGKEYKIQWQKAINAKFKEMSDAYDKYKNTSWLAFPVKAVRGVTYQVKSLAFTKARSDQEDFLLAFEAAQAPFVPFVEGVFDEYQKSLNEVADDSASVRLIYGNYESWYARWKIMSDARSSIDLQYFIVENDAFGLSLLGLCLKKAREGLKIRIMVDMRGSNKMSIKLMAKGYLEELAKFSNVQVKIYNPIHTSLLSIFSDIRRIVSSNHDKILIADGVNAIVGGRNIADEYLVDPVDDKQAWRDTDVLIISREVSMQLQKAFEEEFEQLKSVDVDQSIFGVNRVKQLDIGWRAMDLALFQRGFMAVTDSNKDQSSLIKKLNEQLGKYKHMTGYTGFRLTDKSHQSPVHILDSHSISGPRNDITENIVRYIDGSRREIVIQNPYIVLTPRAEAALKRAARRGVPILVHTNSPQTSDSFPTEAMLYRDWRSILRDIPTMRIFAMVNRGQLHGKNFAFDSEIGIVGTYNFDFLSEKVNSEVVAVVKSPEFSKELRGEIVSDMKDSSVEYRLASADSAEFGPGDVENPQKMWLIKLIAKMGWLKPLF
jgi:putative cardiolipin synthase